MRGGASRPQTAPTSTTAGTLFPRSSKKTARAINAARGNRPVVVLANLSGFDGSPESMRNLQLEYGAEIGRAIVNFDRPIVFCVISRYHGGAFVVFSKALNPQMTVLALEGSFASVIGGAPAAAVVFTPRRGRAYGQGRAGHHTREPSRRGVGDRAGRRSRPSSPRPARPCAARSSARSPTEFDRVHSVHRAVEVGSVDEVISAGQLRPKIVEALAAGLGVDRTPPRA